MVHHQVSSKQFKNRFSKCALTKGDEMQWCKVIEMKVRNKFQQT